MVVRRTARVDPDQFRCLNQHISFKDVISSVCFDVTLTRGLLVVGTELLCPPPNLERIDARFSPSAYLIP